MRSSWSTAEATIAAGPSRVQAAAKRGRRVRDPAQRARRLPRPGSRRRVRGPRHPRDGGPGVVCTVRRKDRRTAGPVALP
ncbi:hypothetical protein GCM10010421_23520 [Streptomyces glaucus]|uniref:Secreted protein n=1 Tax=Streptomyces glaucus TaxID=284029 RepID=A0ABP5WRM8_9ACTN